jgi:hypothetical protein
MEFFHPDIEGLSGLKGKMGLKTHATLAMIQQLRIQVFSFADIGNLYWDLITSSCINPFFIKALHTASWRVQTATHINCSFVRRLTN